MSLPSPRSLQDPRVQALRRQSRELWLEATLGKKPEGPSSVSSSANKSSVQQNGRLQHTASRGYLGQDDDIKPYTQHSGDTDTGARLSAIAETAAAAAGEAAARAEAAEAAAEEAAVEASRAAAAARAAAKAAEAEAAAEEVAEEVDEERTIMREEEDMHGTTDHSSRAPRASLIGTFEEELKLRQWSRDRWADTVRPPSASPLSPTQAEPAFRPPP